MVTEKVEFRPEIMQGQQHSYWQRKLHDLERAKEKIETKLTVYQPSKSFVI
ncbi:MAG TPA: hypothetical protein VLZ54_04620 [Arenibacter sp.]|nr:hypothetical protein [Arenibacter sp.]